MTSQKLVQSNRVNALKSTGPRSDAGKAAVAANALKSGVYAKAEIIPGEDPADLEQLTAEYLDQYAPADPQERYHLDIMIRADWQSRRLARVESQLYIYRSYSLSRIPADAPLGFIYWGTDKVFARLQRQITTAHRTYTEASRELTEASRELASLQSARASAASSGAGVALGPPATPVSTPASSPAESTTNQDPPAVTPAAQTTSTEIGFVSSTRPHPLSTSSSASPQPPAQNLPLRPTTEQSGQPSIPLERALQVYWSGGNKL